MNRRQDPKDDFESRLLAELKARVAERDDAAARSEAAAAIPTPAWRRRGPRLALVGALALAGVVVALIVGAGGGDGSTAFAVEPQPGGGVTIKIFSLEDASGLEAALEDAGIRSQINWLPAGMVCREPRYKPSMVHNPGGGVFGGASIGGPGAITISVGDTSRARSLKGIRARRNLPPGIPGRPRFGRQPEPRPDRVPPRSKRRHLRDAGPI